MPPSVKTYALSDGSKLPWLAFGTGSAFNKKPCADFVSLALSLGFTHIDTAERYQTESEVGQAISSSNSPRSSIYVTTKLDLLPEGKSVEDSLRGSLERLKLEYVDLYLVHAPHVFLYRPGGIEQGWREMVEVKRKGLARSIGVSNFNIRYLEEIINLGLEKPVVNQMEYHVLVSKRLEPLLGYQRSHGILTAAFSALRPLFPDPTNDSEIIPTCTSIKSVLDSIASSLGPTVTSNQVLFKWLDKKGIITVTTSTKEWRLKEYLETEKIRELTEEEVQRIEQSTGSAHYRFFKQGAFIDDNSAVI